MSPRQKAAASLLAIFFVGTAALMALPWYPVRQKVHRWLAPTSPLLYHLGLHHKLALFSPEPPRFTGKVLYQVTFSDGSRSFWKQKRSRLAPLDPEGIFDRYMFYYTVWSFGVGGGRGLMDPLARHIADESYEPGKQPVTVDMIEQFAKLPPPEQGLGQPPPALDREIHFFSYDVASRQGKQVGRPIIW